MASGNIIDFVSESSLLRTDLIDGMCKDEHLRACGSAFYLKSDAPAVFI